MTVKLFQLRGTDDHGERHIFNSDAVYAVDGDTEKKVGFIDRRRGARFAPIGKFTEDEIEAIVAGINEVRADRFGPVAGSGSSPPSPEAVERAKEELDEEDGADE